MPTTNTRTSARTRRLRTPNLHPSLQKTTKASNGKSSKSENGSANGNSQLDKLFTDSLKDIYWAEKHLTKTLPKMKSSNY